MKTEQEAKEAIAHRLYLNRKSQQIEGTPDEDWKKAEQIYKSPLRFGLFRLNTPFVWMERRVIEPTNQKLNHFELFRIFEKVSPVLEAIGVIAIPVVLAIVTIQYQEQINQRDLKQLQQETVSAYLSQLSSILLDVEAEDLRKPENDQIRTLIRATTLTLLSDPNLDGDHKGQVIRFLIEMNLVQDISINQETSAKNELQDPIISLNNANLSDVNLFDTNLSNIDFTGVSFNNANLNSTNLTEVSIFDATLIRTTLTDADLSDASLSYVNLTNSNLANANLTHASLFMTNFRNTNLSNVNFTNASFWFPDFGDANLSNALFIKTDLVGAWMKGSILSGSIFLLTDLSKTQELTLEQLEGYTPPLLCGVNLPNHITTINPDRDCSQIEERLRTRDEYRSGEAAQLVEEAQNKAWD